MKHSDPFSERSETFDHFRWNTCNVIHQDLVQAKHNVDSALKNFDVWLLIESAEVIRKAGDRLTKAQNKLDRIEGLVSPETKPSLNEYMELKEWLKKTHEWQVKLNTWAVGAVNDYNY